MHSRVFGSLSCEYAKIDGGFWLDETFVAGSMSLRNSGFSELRTDKKTHSSLAPTNTGESDVVPFEIDGNIDLTGAAVGGDVRLIGVVIGGHLNLQTARIQGGILCRSAADLKESGRSEIRGRAWLLGVETGRRQFRDCNGYSRGPHYCRSSKDRPKCGPDGTRSRKTLWW